MKCDKCGTEVYFRDFESGRTWFEGQEPERRIHPPHTVERCLRAQLADERERADRAEQMLAESEAALKESQDERDALQERLDVYEPPVRPRKST